MWICTAKPEQSLRNPKKISAGPFPLPTDAILPFGKQAAAPTPGSSKGSKIKAESWKCPVLFDRSWDSENHSGSPIQSTSRPGRLQTSFGRARGKMVHFEQRDGGSPMSRKWITTAAIVFCFCVAGMVVGAQQKSIDLEGHQWWQHAVFYEVYTRSFADSNNDG